MTTTALDIDEELLNRCLVLSVDEGREQTQAIHARAARAAHPRGSAWLDGEREAVVKLAPERAAAARAARRGRIPTPTSSTFLDDRTRTRRDHEKYLTLIDTIALLHQHQRPVHERCSTASDRRVHRGRRSTTSQLANALAHEVLGRSLDELPPQTRRLLSSSLSWWSERCRAQRIRRAQHRFSRRALREATGWGTRS